jgi:DNA repair protein RecO (recombination protein O)
MIITSNAIVLSITRYNDDTIIAETYTKTSGIVSFAVKINRSARAAIRHTLFQPLAILELSWEEKSSQKKLQRPKSAKTAYNYTSLTYDAHKMAIALFIAEFLHHALRNEPDSLYIYEYIEQSLLWLDHCTRNFANFHLVFLVKLTHFLGISPNVENPERYKYFDLRKGCLVGAQPTHTDFIPNPEAQFIPMLLRMRYENMHVFKFNGTERSRLLHDLNIYYRIHLEGFPELKSLAILKEIF